jgi:hypothetical protein
LRDRAALGALLWPTGDAHAQGYEEIEARAAIAADAGIQRDYTFVVGSVGDDRLDACLRVDTSVSPTSCRCPHRSKCGSLRGPGPAPPIRLEARA